MELSRTSFSIDTAPLLFDCDSQSEELHVEVCNNTIAREDNLQTINSYCSISVVSSGLDSFSPWLPGQQENPSLYSIFTAA